MDNTSYNELMQYLVDGIIPKGMDPIEYQQWANQFEEKGQNIYYLKRKVIPRSLVLTIISIHHDDPTAAHQSKDAVYNLIKGRYT